MNQKLFKNALGFLISAALIVWLYFSISWGEVWQQLKTVNFIIVPLIVILLLVHFYFRALRWRYLLPESERPGDLPALFDCIMMGNFATYILPLRAGEFIRPYLLTQFSSYSFSASFSSVVVERFFDLATVLLMFAFVVAEVNGLPEWSKEGASVLGIMAVGIFAFIIAGSIFPRAILSLTSKITDFFPAKLKERADLFLKDFLASAGTLSNVRRLAVVLALTGVVWGFCVIFTYAGLYLLPGDFSLLMAVTITVVVALAVAAPSAPGFIGVYQTACIASFQIFGFSSEMAVTYSIVTHLINYLLFGAAALYFFMRRGLGFKQALGRTGR